MSARPHEKAQDQCTECARLVSEAVTCRSESQCCAFSSSAWRRGCANQASTIFAPEVDAEKFSIHTSGTLDDVIQTLGMIAGREIRPYALRRDDMLPEAVRNEPVSLNFDNATLPDILDSLCKQAGVV